MTRKNRHLVYEGAAVLFADAMLVMFIVPALLNSRDTMFFFAGGMIAVSAVAWTLFYIYRLNEGVSK